jgi:hypothetical protein
MKVVKPDSHNYVSTKANEMFGGAIFSDGQRARSRAGLGCLNLFGERSNFELSRKIALGRARSGEKGRV